MEVDGVAGEVPPMRLDEHTIDLFKIDDAGLVKTCMFVKSRASLADR